jgi:hypothetical protein
MLTGGKHRRWLAWLVCEAFIEVDQFNEPLAIAPMIGMVPLGQLPKALFNLRDSCIRR